MKNLNERSEFERQWEDIFKEAEMAPSEGVWDKIDSALSKEEAGYFKKRAFYFRLLAAASIAFALGVSIFSINYYLGHNADQSVVENTDGNIGTINHAESNAPGESAIIDGKINQRGGEEQIESQRGNLSDSNFLTQSENQEIKSEEVNSIPFISTPDNREIISAESNEPAASREFYNAKSIELKGIDLYTRNEMIYDIDHIYLIPIMPKGASKQRTVKGTQFLASLDFSTGVFDPNFQQGGSTLASSPNALFSGARVESVNDQLASFNTTNKDFLLVRSAGQETRPEISFSYGANVGFKLSRRIVLLTGIAYRKANTTTTTTGYFEDAESNARIPIVASHQYQLNGLSSVNRIDETDLRNQYEFASIPVRAGYVVYDKKFNVTLLAGISSEFFLNNRIVDPSNYLETLSSSSSDASPYKSVYFNGTLGTMLGYSFAKNYLISIEPTYRFAMNSFTRDDFYLNSLPKSFMVSFGVTYNFK